MTGQKLPFFFFFFGWGGNHGHYCVKTLMHKETVLHCILKVWVLYMKLMIYFLFSLLIRDWRVIPNDLHLSWEIV